MNNNDNGYLDIGSGFYEKTPGAVALAEQQRAHALKNLKTAKAVCLSYQMDEDAVYTHWTLYNNEDNDASMFLIWSILKTFRCFTEITGLTNLQTVDLILNMLKENVD